MVLSLWSMLASLVAYHLGTLMTIFSKSGDIPTHQYCYVERSYITNGEMRGVEPCVWFGIVAYTGRVW